jgi:hypothetical protein
MKEANQIAMYYRISTISHSGNSKMRETAKEQLAARSWGERRIYRQSTELLVGSEIILFHSIMIDKCHLFPNTQKKYNTNNEPNVNYGLLC